MWSSEFEGCGPTHTATKHSNKILHCIDLVVVVVVALIARRLLVLQLYCHID